MMQRSAEAPHQWSLEQTEDAVRSFVSARDPDVVCFQELPGLVPYLDTHSLVPSVTVSHSGHIATLVRSSMMEEAQHSTQEGFGVVVNLAGLSIANVHLAPGPDGAPMRKAMLEQIAKVDGPLAVIGDTNMRMAEWEDLGDLAAAKPPTPTWDSRRNRFNAEIPEFSAYFTNVITRSVQPGDLVVYTQRHQHLDRQFFLSDHYPLGGQLVF